MDDESDIKLLERGYWLALIFAIAGISLDSYQRRKEIAALKLDLQAYVWWLVSDSSHLVIAAGSLFLAAFMVVSVMRHQHKPDKDKDKPE